MNYHSGKPSQPQPKGKERDNPLWKVSLGIGCHSVFCLYLCSAGAITNPTYVDIYTARCRAKRRVSAAIGRDRMCMCFMYTGGSAQGAGGIITHGPPDLGNQGGVTILYGGRMASRTVQNGLRVILRILRIPEETSSDSIAPSPLVEAAMKRARHPEP